VAYKNGIYTDKICSREHSQSLLDAGTALSPLITAVIGGDENFIFFNSVRLIASANCRALRLRPLANKSTVPCRFPARANARTIAKYVCAVILLSSIKRSDKNLIKHRATQVPSHPEFGNRISHVAPGSRNSPRVCFGNRDMAKSDRMIRQRIWSIVGREYTSLSSNIV